MAERLVGGDLPAVLTTMFDRSHNWELVSRDLYAKHGVVVGARTLAKWVAELGIEAVA